MQQIRNTSIYKILKDKEELLFNTRLYRLFDFLLPDLSTEFFALLLYALPKQIHYHMKLSGEVDD